MRPEWRKQFHKLRLKGVIARLGRWTLIGVVYTLAFIGFLHITRGTAVRHVRGVGAAGGSLAVGEPQFPLVVTMLTGTLLTSGNRVEVTLNGDGTYARLWDDLRSARESITLQLYYGAPGLMGQTLGQILLDRAKAGVRVFVLYDAFGTVDIPANHRDALRAAGAYAVVTPDQYVDELRAAPFPFAMFHPMCGGIPPDLAWSSLRLFEHEVMPAFA